MCEGCCGDVVHALYGIASILHGDMSEASFEERRGQLVHEVEVDGPLLVPGTPGTHGGGTVASMRSSSAGLWVKRTAANSGVRSQKEMTAHLRFPFRRLRAGYSRWGRVCVVGLPEEPFVLTAPSRQYWPTLNVDTNPLCPNTSNVSRNDSPNLSSPRRISNSSKPLNAKL